MKTRNLILPIISILLLGSLTSCESNLLTSTGLIGKWKLTEVLSDPGDGSGVFHAVQSDKTIEFHSNGTVTSNGSLCNMSIGSDMSSSTTYSIVDANAGSFDCIHDVPFPVSFELDDSQSTLIVSYPCIEPCLAKYERVEKVELE